MVLEKYLQRNGTQLETIIEQVDDRETHINNIQIILYSDELLQVISQAVGKETSVVLFELLSLENTEAAVNISLTKDLIKAVNIRTPYIFIPEHVRSENSRLVNSVLSEKDTLGINLGSAGKATLFGEIIYQIQKIFSNDSKEFLDLKSKLRHYFVRIHDEKGTFIYERQQAY